MRVMTVMVGAAVLAVWSGGAWAAKPCDELKGEIVAKLEAKGVKNYTLEIVAADAVKDQKVVGSCEGGAKKIVYSRASAMPPSDNAAAKAGSAAPTN
jgi:Protein of unknown function (DUF1161)